MKNQSQKLKNNGSALKKAYYMQMKKQHQNLKEDQNRSG